MKALIKNLGIEEVAKLQGIYSVDYIDDIKKALSNKNSEVKEIIQKELYGLIVNGEHLLYVGVD